MNNLSSKNQMPSIGQQGENLALNYLENKGYKIIERNYRYGRGEIDIIAEKDQMLIFIEVKTKKFGDFGDPIYWITRKKQRQIGTVAKGYLFERNITDRDCRFDVITLTWEEGAWKIDHIEDAFWL